MKKENIILLVFGLLIVLIIGLFIHLNPLNKENDNPINTNNSDNKKINVYLFWGNGCPHCEHAKEFFYDNSEYSKYYNLVDYEVWYNEENQELMENVASEFNIEVSGVPFIVIGDNYFSGYSSSMDDAINKTIISMYESDEYIDVVENVE